MVEAGAAWWFGALGLEVAGVEEALGEVAVGVQTPGGREVFCGSCGRRARSKGRREVVLRDAPGADGRPVRVRWNKRVWECRDPRCGAGSWTERSELAGPRRVLTCRAQRWAVGRLAAVEGSVGSAARRLGVSWNTVWSAVEAAEQIAGDPDRVGPTERVGFDETVMASASRRRRRRFTTAAVDASTGQIVDIFDGRDAAGLQRLRTALDQGDPYDEVADCWAAKEKIRQVFKTAEPKQAAARLDDAIAYSAAPEAAPELHKLAATQKRRRTEILASTTTGTNNGRTEAANPRNQRRQTLSPRPPKPPQLPAQNPPRRQTTTPPNPTRHKNQNPTSPPHRVEPISPTSTDEFTLVNPSESRNFAPADTALLPHHAESVEEQPPAQSDGSPRYSSLATAGAWTST